MAGPDDDDPYGIFSGGAGSDAGVAEAEDEEDTYGIFKPPSKVASSEPMGPPPPPEPPKEWWEDILGKANEVVSTDEGRAGGWRAALQGASLNTADNLVRWADPSFADSLDQAAKDSPVMHGLGQAGTGIAAGIAAGPAIGAQMLAQAGLSAISAAADGEGFWPGRDAEGRPQMGVAVSGTGGALMGAGGQMASNVAGKTARALGGTKAGQWAGRQLGRLWPAADDAAVTAGRAAAPRALTPEAVESSAEFLARERAAVEGLRKPPASAPSVADDEPILDLLSRKPPAPEPPMVDVVYEPPPPSLHRAPTTPPSPEVTESPADFLARERAYYGSLAEPAPPPRAPYPPAPSAPPSTYPGPDEQALLDLFASRRARGPSSPAPSAPPPPPTPDMDEEALVHLLGGQPKAARGEGGRFVKRPYETPGEKLLRMDAPASGPPRASLSEPPVPIAEPPVPPVPLSPQERLLRTDVPHEPVPVSEPPLPIDEPPPMPRESYLSPQERLLRTGEPLPEPRVGEPLPLNEPPLPPPPSYADLLRNEPRLGPRSTARAPEPPLPLGEPYVPPAQSERYVSPGERLLRVGEPLPAPRVGEPLGLPYEMPGSVPKMPPLRASEAYETAATARTPGAPGAPSAPRTMFHDLHDTLKFSPTYRKMTGAVKLADRAMNMAGGQETNLAAQAGRAGFELAQETGLPGLFDQKVNAQDYREERPAVADLPTLHYALQATLASGRAGLSPEDEQALTEAVVQGDQAAISATDFRLRQRYPAYARRVERELRAYNEED